MGILDLLKLSTRMFKARTSRTVLTILGMGVGVGAILFLVALGYGIQKTLLETITTADSLLTLDVYPGETRQSIIADDINKIKEINGVDLISPVFETVGQMKYASLVSDAKITAVDENFLDLDGVKIVQGEKINDDEIQGMVISNSLAKVFEKTPEEMLGTEVKVFLSKDGKVSGKKQEFNFKIMGFVDKKEISAFINSKALGDPPVSVFSKLKIKCSSSQIMNETRESIANEGFLVSALTDLINQVDKAFKVIRIVLGFFGAIALMVSAIGMFNTMTVALMERTEEIGIMKSIGASDYDILWMFVFESTIMGFLGGVSGIALGILGGNIFNLAVNFLAKSLGGSVVNIFYFPVWFLLFILGAATLVGFFTGVIPARKASATDPLDALRYK
ncbi:MAG TPA: hypothetical protein DCS28_00585 [Candidatus Moranbacteria bacterium]|nr:hypothetical protein [Candidatus Moranbacteria bacterium]HAT74527.1 hypothetical protein [Candidatus Moranbacteria bacterium]